MVRALARAAGRVARRLARPFGGRRMEDIATPAARRRAWLDFHFLDHGALRVLWRNLEEIAPGVWRSNQPSPGQLARLRARGVRAVLNLRGAKPFAYYHLEREACARLGLTFVNLPLAAGRPVPAATLLELHEVFRRLPRPFLMHCKSGADRTGIAAALYLLMIEEAPVEVARRALHWRFLHFRTGKAGVLDLFLDAFAEARAARGVSILEWIRDGYDAEALARRHAARQGGQAGPRALPPPPRKAVWHPPLPAGGGGG